MREFPIQPHSLNILSPLFRVDYFPQTHRMYGGQCMCRHQHAFFVPFARSDRAPDRRLTVGMCRRQHALYLFARRDRPPPRRLGYRMTMTPSALRVYPPQTLLEERMRLAAHGPMCAPPPRIVATKSEKPSQPSPEEGARQAAPGGPCVRHNGIAAGRACAAPPVACRDRGGRRQWHVGIASGAASGMSGSRRAPPVACRNRGGLALCRSRFVRTTWGFPGLRALRPTCAERRDRSRTSTRCFARASRRTVATALPSPLLRDQSDQTVGIHAYPRPSACAGSFPALALCRSLFVRTTVAGGGSRGCVPCGPRVAITAGRERAVPPARRVGRSRPHTPALC